MMLPLLFLVMIFGHHIDQIVTKKPLHILMITYLLFFFLLSQTKKNQIAVNLFLMKTEKSLSKFSSQNVMTSFQNNV